MSFDSKLLHQYLHVWLVLCHAYAENTMMCNFGVCPMSLTESVEVRTIPKNALNTVIHGQVWPQRAVKCVMTCVYVYIYFFKGRIVMWCLHNVIWLIGLWFRVYCGLNVTKLERKCLQVKFHPAPHICWSRAPSWGGFGVKFWNWEWFVMVMNGT